MAYGLIGFFLFKDTPKYPDFPPEFGTQVGWMIFAAVALVVLFSWTRAHSVRRALLALEDPRTMAILRIGFGLFTLFCFWNLAPYWRMLWSDEGVFDLAYAQDRLGRSALRGWTPQEGFFGISDDAETFSDKFEQWKLWSIGVFLWNKPSLHYMYGSPSFVNGYMFVFFLVLLLYAAGVLSRVTGIISWLMMSGLYNRNALYWEGTDTVYRCFWIILLFAKTGHAWSFDNWWRCRRLRKQGRLLEAGQPHAEPEEPEESQESSGETSQEDSGESVAKREPSAPKKAASTARKEPVYRLIPAWPRYLFMMQLAAIYITTGSVKTGSVWEKGDALYYALNMDHFYRFEYWTQWISSVVGMNLFRVNSWVTHWWERLFPLVLIGVGLRFNLEHRDKPWFQRQRVWWRRLLSWGAMAGVYALVYRLVFIVTPFCTPLANDKVQHEIIAKKLVLIHVFFGGIVPTFALLWIVLGIWPLTFFKGGRSLGKLTKKFAWARLPQFTITQDTVRWLFVGRRMWLTIGCIFHGTLIGFMNIGMFAPIMLMAYPCFVRGDEWVRIFRWLRGWGPWRNRKAKEGDPPEAWLADAQAPEDVRVRGRSLPDVLVLVLGLGGAWLITKKVDKVDWLDTATYWWLGCILAFAAVVRLWPTRPSDLTGGRSPALAYTAIGRSLALFAVVWHASAVALHLWPSYPIFSKWRSPARTVHSSWLRGVGATQSWRMFSPNPPRSNTFMKTVVVLENGEKWDLRNNAYHYESDEILPSRPIPWIINDRMRKMQRRMVGKGKWYLRYWADYQCREWMLEHGEMPEKIEIRKYTNRIPSPEVTSYWAPAKFKGRKDRASGATIGEPYNPRKLKTREIDVQSHKCKERELPVFMKERYGMEISGADEAAAERDAVQRERKFKSRRQTWDRRKDWGRWFSEDAKPKPKKKPVSTFRSGANAAPARSVDVLKNAGKAAEEDPEDHGGDDDGVDEDEKVE